MTGGWPGPGPDRGLDRHGGCQPEGRPTAGRSTVWCRACWICCLRASTSATPRRRSWGTDRPGPRGGPLLPRRSRRCPGRTATEEAHWRSGRGVVIRDGCIRAPDSRRTPRTCLREWWGNSGRRMRRLGRYATQLRRLWSGPTVSTGVSDHRELTPTPSRRPGRRGTSGVSPRLREHLPPAVRTADPRAAPGGGTPRTAPPGTGPTGSVRRPTRDRARRAHRSADHPGGAAGTSHGPRASA